MPKDVIFQGLDESTIEKRRLENIQLIGLNLGNLLETMRKNPFNWTFENTSIILGQIQSWIYEHNRTLTRK